jgi:hypothetical protein
MRLVKSRSSSRAPVRSRPFMPGYDMMFRKDKASLSWKWAADRLSEAHNYFLSTTRPDGRPHVMPIWGVWLDNQFYFSTGRQSRKSKNLSQNPRCVVCPENASGAVILEGTAKKIRSGSLLRKLLAAYRRKYGSDIGDAKDPIYEVRPQVIFGIAENAEGNPTRWRFNKL